MKGGYIFHVGLVWFNEMPLENMSFYEASPDPSYKVGSLTHQPKPEIEKQSAPSSAIFLLNKHGFCIFNIHIAASL